MAKISEKPEVQSGQTAVPIRWVGEQEQPFLFADQLHVRAVQSRVYLSFGQVNLPVFDGAPPKDFIAEIHPVVRLVMPADELQRVIAALNTVADAMRASPQE